MAEYKKQHYVPKLILRNFCVSKNGLYYYNKERPNKGVELRNIDKIFQSHYIFTPIVPGTDDRAIEYESEYLGMLDNTFAPLVQRWSEEVISGKNPEITQEEKWIVNVVFQLHMKKAPEYAQKVESILSNAKDWQSAIAELEGLTGTQFGDEAKKQFGEMDDPMVFLRYYATFAQLVPQPEIEKLFFTNSSLIFTTPQKNDDQFVVGSRCVYAKKKGLKSSITKTQAEFWMPIHPKVSLVLIHGAEKIEPTVFEIEPYAMKHVNTHVVEASGETGSKSEELLNEYVSELTEKQI